MAQKEGLAKKPLTLSQLTLYDDVITDALVDRVYFWTTIRKNRARFSPSRGIHEEEIANILRSTVIVDKDPAKATTELLQLVGLRKYVEKLATQDEKDHFQRHLRKYVNIYMPDCPFEASTTNRYTVDTHEAAVLARRDIKKGEVIKYLSGIQVAMTKEEEKNLDLTRRDFSIVMSSRKKTPSLFLGPARFANHDCSANARLATTGAHGMQVVAASDIVLGDEITVSYGTDYFGEDNCECLCATCEKFNRNGWAREVGYSDGESDDEDEVTSVGEEAEERPYSLRGKRKYLSESESLSRPSTPDQSRDRAKRRKVEPSKLQEETTLTKLRGRRSVREVEIKLERPSPQPGNLTPLVNMSAEAHVKAKIPTRLESPSAGKRKTKTRTRTDSLDDSDHSGLDSAASSTANQSTQSTAATSVDDDIIVVKRPENWLLELYAHIEARMPLPAPRSALKRVSVDTSSELSSLSGFEVDEKTQQAVRRKKSRPKKLCQKELRALLEGSVEPEEESKAVITTEVEITTVRRPGDYTLTPLLLCSKYSRWVVCNTCDADFVQEDAYLTRKECPRCERHSKLYGYAWPKTDREGKYDTEERIMDHRTVHRFVRPDEEKAIKKGRKSLHEELLKRQLSVDSERARTDSSMEAESPRRGLRKKRSRLIMSAA